MSQHAKVSALAAPGFQAALQGPFDRVTSTIELRACGVVTTATASSRLTRWTRSRRAWYARNSRSGRAARRPHAAPTSQCENRPTHPVNSSARHTDPYLVERNAGETSRALRVRPCPAIPKCDRRAEASSTRAPDQSLVFTDGSTAANSMTASSSGCAISRQSSSPRRPSPLKQLQSVTSEQPSAPRSRVEETNGIDVASV